MKKILLLIIALGIIGSVSWFFYKKSQMAQNPTVAPTFKSLFFSNTPAETKSTGNGFKLGDLFNNSSSVEKSVSPFKRLTTYPIAGLVAYDLVTTKTLPVPKETPKVSPIVETTTKKVVRYVSRRNGYVYEIESGASPLQITNISIPNIYEAIFTNSNNNVLLRFLRDDDKTIATYNTPIPKENPDGTRTQIAGSFLPDNITSIDVSLDGNKIIYLIPNQDGSTITISDYAGLKKSVFMNSTFEEWLISWVTDKKIFFQTKASYLADGFLYSIDISEKKLRRIIGGISGLTTSVSPLGNYVVYSESLQDGFGTRIFNIKNNSDINIGLAILPEKCVWLKTENLICAGNDLVSGLYPDDWYKGVRVFSDKIYLVNPTDSSIKILYDGSSESFDITNLQIDEVGKSLYFIDKSTGHLWKFNY